MTETPDHDADPQEPAPPRPDLPENPQDAPADERASESAMPTETPAAEEPAMESDETSGI